MIEKRFTISDTDILCMTIIDNKNGKHYGFAKDIAIIMNDLNEENEQLKQQCKELRNNLIDHSALIDMLEKVKALDIEDMIWNTMGYKTQTEFDDDFADYREDAKKRWRE